MFSAHKTLLKMAPLMDANTLTIFDWAKDELGGMQTEFLGRFVLSLILTAGEQRARQTNKKPCYIFIDEADTIIARTPDVAQIIYKLRSQRVAFLAANQSLSQLSEPKVLSALNDCGIRYVNAKNDAPAVAQNMGMKAEDIRALRVGEFALSLRGQAAQKVKIPLPDYNRYQMASQDELEARTAYFKKHYCYTPQTKQLQQRSMPDETWDGKSVI
jgi:hypothetical protein